jgi:TonB family protein
MAKALLYQSNQSWRVGIAFGAAVLIHFSAIALAAIYKGPPVEEPSMGYDFPVVGEITTIAPTEEPTPPSIEPEMSPSLVPINESSFPEDRPTPVPVPRQTTRLTLPFVKEKTASAGSITLSTARAVVLSAPRPEYPYEARRQRITGSGVVLLKVDSASGNVADVSMWQSTGSPVLDNATVTAFKRWRFKPGTVSRVKSPITYTMTGAAY